MTIGEVIPAGFSFDVFAFLPEQIIASELVVNGDFEFGATASVLFDIFGPIPGETAEGFDFLFVEGELALDGDLLVALDPVFAESLLSGEELTIATGGSISGVFDNVENGGTLSTSDGLFTFEVNYGDGRDSITLSNFAVAVPEPGCTTLFLLFGFIASLNRNRKKLD